MASVRIVNFIIFTSTFEYFNFPSVATVERLLLR